MYLVLYLSRNATPLSRNVIKPTFLSSSSNSYLFILFQLQCLSFSFFNRVIVFIILQICFPTQGIWESGNRGLLNITRAFHKLIGNFLATSGILSNFFRFEQPHNETQWGLSGSTSKECGFDRPAFLA